MREQYYAYLSNEVEGPFDIAQIAKLYNSGEIGPNTKLCKKGTERWQKYHEVFPEPAKQPLVAQAVQQQPPQVIHVHPPASHNQSGKSDVAALLIALFFGPFGLIYKGNGSAAMVWFILLFLGLIFTAGIAWFIMWPIMLVHTACATPPTPPRQQQ